MEKYLKQIHELRAQMRELWAKGDPRFYELQKELNKVWRNAQSYCKRHGIEFPRNELMRAETKQYTAFVDTWQGTHELGTYSSPEQAHEAIESFTYEAGLRLGVDCSDCVVESESSSH